MELSSPSSSSFSLFSEINNGKSTIDHDETNNHHELSTADSIPNYPDHHLLNSENPNKNNQIPKSDSSIDSSNRVSVKKNKKVAVPSSSSSTSHKGGFRMVNKRRIVDFGGGKTRAEIYLDSLALPLGMSFAAVVAQVLDKKTTAGERIQADHLSQICTEALKESLAKVYGNRFDSFVRNFEASFETTLRTLRMIDTTFSEKVKDPLVHSRIKDYISEVAQPALSEEQVRPLSRSSVRSHHSDAVPSTCGVHEPSFSSFEERNDESSNDSINQDLILHRQINQQLSSISQNSLVSHRSGKNQCMLSTFEKSVEEHARSNDLKSFEIGLKMKELQLKEEKLSVSYDSNRLEKCKLSMGISKATFRAEKFKTQLEDARHAELLKKCIDCLVAGLFIMSACLMYGAYIYSYQRITEITASCTMPPKESTSWWMPKQVSSINSGLHTLRCQIEVISRMMFGILMILVIGYLLLQRSSSSKQTMPITIIVMLLAVACGFMGKFCVDTLGGSGFLWLLYWEVLCTVHFFANICTSVLFILLYGPVPVSSGTNINTKPPYWIRRFLFYAVILSVPVLCGLMPFAGPREWIDHFFSRVRDALFGPEEVWE
ncbi:hypothetical protein MKX03_014926 [Papaver bracteatum]|nr:hypothetical protein MKX03_014926 [Papaver bracteatum]